MRQSFSAIVIPIERLPTYFFVVCGTQSLRLAGQLSKLNIRCPTETVL